MKGFIKSNMTMVVLTTLSSGINYLCQIAMGHAMSFALYDEMFFFVVYTGMGYSAGLICHVYGKKAGNAEMMKQFATSESDSHFGR